MTFTTLDEMERKILPSDTMVCDVEGPSVIGGIMGGFTSSVKEDTTRIFIEAANWIDARIRHTSTRLGLRTDSSQRYEKSLDTNQLEKAVLRILELVLESCPEAKVVGKIESDGVIPTPELKISLDPVRVNSILGTSLSAAEITANLEALDFIVEPAGDLLIVTVPQFPGYQRCGGGCGSDRRGGKSLWLRQACSPGPSQCRFCREPDPGQENAEKGSGLYGLQRTGSGSFILTPWWGRNFWIRLCGLSEMRASNW